jgi:protein-tyrosine phosphatase
MHWLDEQGDTRSFGGPHHPDKAFHTDLDREIEARRVRGTVIGGGPAMETGTARHQAYTPTPIVYNGATGYVHGAPATSQQVVPYTKFCKGHRGDQIVWTYANGTTLRGGSKMEISLMDLDFVVDCVGLDSVRPPVKMNSKWAAALNAFLAGPEIVPLDWPDRGIISVTWEFWRTLRANFPVGGKVACCCFGGHGRTGTALASLLVEEGVDPGDAVDIVRDLHCEDAIESKTQMNYVYWLADHMPPREGEKGKKGVKMVGV